MSDTREITKGMERLLVRLNQHYGVDLMPYVNNKAHLVQVYEHYRAMCNHLRVYLGESTCFSDKQYTKAYLISEAARLLLREIAPKRNKKRKSK